MKILYVLAALWIIGGWIFDMIERNAENDDEVE